MKTRHEESAPRGQTLRTETARDRSDEKPSKDMTMGKEMGGGPDSISHSIKSGRVPQD